ncbi:hypothetical protein ACH5RR_037814 [Cinchona calisaya]|uniref:Terpene synthase metal-binding domain-containing protein n=1 Tax=Cinchona calisaya TaxID=153742 RepID=A0ABD2YBZ9_9GENT
MQYEDEKLARECFQEAKWFYDGCVPTMEEYMKTAVFTAGYMILATISLAGMGDSVNKEAFVWVTNEPLMLRASSTIIRLSDDMFSHEFEQKRGHVASSIECYMNEHGASKQESIDEFQKQVTNAWKDINKECLGQTLVPMPVLERVLNL